MKLNTINNISKGLTLIAICWVLVFSSPIVPAILCGTSILLQGYLYYKKKARKFKQK